MTRFEWYGRYHAARMFRRKVASLGKGSPYVRLTRDGRIEFFSLGSRTGVSIHIPYSAYDSCPLP